MNLSSIGRAAAACALLSTSVGCGGGLFDTMNGYNAQACAEAALRRHHDAGVDAEAFALFASHCASDDAGACSALGVAHEIGIGVAPDPAAAAVAYRRACDLGNVRGCANFALLDVARHPGDVDVARRARRALEASCDERDPLACGRLGRWIRDGVGGAVDVSAAVPLFEQSCDAGDDAACMDLAAAVVVASPERAMALYARGCTAGVPEACIALDAAGRRSNDPRGAVAAR